MLSHRIRPVASPLAPHVEHLWMVRGQLPGLLRNMILPDGAMELIVNLGDPQRLCSPDDPERQTVFRSSWVSGERAEADRHRGGWLCPSHRYPVACGRC